MKSKSIAFKSGLVLLLLSFTWILSNAQSVSVSGTQPVNIGCEYQYTAAVSNVPSTWTIVDYKWEARYIGVSGKMKYVSGYDGQGNPVYTTTNLQAAVNAKTKDLWATWDGTRYPFPAEVVFQIRYQVPNSTIIYESGFYYTSPAQIFIKGIPASPALNSSTGSANIQKCCTGNVTFTASNYGDANTFDNWVYPSGWTLISQSGNSITLLPDASTGGAVSCRVGLTTACPAIYKTASINISRTDAVISIVDNEFPLLRICANSSFTYKINPVCGAASYSWQFPTGWTITSGGTSSTVTVSTGSSPQSGNIIVSANFTGCTSASSTFAINPLSAVPPTPVPDYYHKEYHCDTWNVCFNGSSIYHYIQNEAQTYTYTIVSPWRFLDSGGQAVYTVTLNYNEVPPAISLPAGNTRTFGTYKVKANNCLGSSAELVVPFVREADCWCDGTYPTPYPNGILIETCVTPPCGGGQQMLASPAEEEAALTAGDESLSMEQGLSSKTILFPNPVSGMLTISFSQTGKKTMLVYNDQGKLIKRIVSAVDTITIDCSSFSKGVYHTIIRYADGKSENHPFIVNKD